MKSQSKIAVPLLLLLLAPLLAATVGALAGSWKPIKNVADAHVQEIAKFAVTEYNNQSKSHLKFQRVISGETQVVAGTNYRLILAVTGGRRSTEKYVAVVWEKAWLNFKNLTSFDPVKG